jgi:hypothetical protein
VSELDIVALLGADDVARKEALDRAVAKGQELPFSVLMAALATAPRGSEWARGWLERLVQPGSEEGVLEVWDLPLVRRAGLALGLRWGDQLAGGVGHFLWAELDILRPDDPEDFADLGAALEAIASVAPEETLRLSGLCAAVSVAWLETLPSERSRHLVESYADHLGGALSEGTLPPPVDANALLALELLGARDGQWLLESLTRGGRTLADVAAVLVRTCVGVGLAGAADGREDLNDSADSEPVDASEIRGLLDSMQVPYDDVTGDSWAATITYKGSFGEKDRAPLYIGLTGRRLIMRVVLEGVELSPQALLRQSRYTGLASFSLDSEERVCVGVELARDGFSEEAFALGMADLMGAIEWVVSQ